MHKSKFITLIAILLFTLGLGRLVLVQAQESGEEDNTITVTIFDDTTTQPVQINESQSQLNPSIQLTATAPYSSYLPLIIKDYALLASDNFNDPNSGWLNGIDVSIAKIGYLGGEYQIVNKTNSRIIAVTDSDYTFTQFAAEITARTEGSINGGYGFIFGFNNETPSEATTAYIFQIRPSTKEWKYTLQDLVTNTGQTLVEGTSSAINSGQASNVVQLELTSSVLVLSVNGTELLNTTSPTSATTSRVGLINAPISDTNHDARFENFAVFKR